MSFSQYTAAALLNSMFGKTSAFGALADAPDIYVALSSTTPSETGTNVTEPSGGGYARVETAAADWEAATDADPSVVANAETVVFAQATGTWLTGSDLTHFALYDAATDGNFLGAGALNTAKPVLEDDIAEFAAGDLTISLD